MVAAAIQDDEKKRHTEKVVKFLRVHLHKARLPCSARTIRCILKGFTNGPVPSVSTISNILKKQGLTRKHRARRLRTIPLTGRPIGKKK